MGDILDPPEQTLGYRYHMGIHFVLTHGPVDAVTHIVVGDRVAWEGNVTASQRITINAEELFGGDKREGGVQGEVDVEFGDATQGQNGYLSAHNGSPLPAFRGVLGFVFRQVYLTANNPYIKPVSMVVRRVPSAWNPSQALIGTGANPAHIVRECLTDSAWGMGYPESSIDDASFEAAAATLVTEAFGLSFLWTQQRQIRDFVQEVIDHVSGALTVSPSTGKFQLKLIRADYDVGTLPVMDEDTIVAVESYQRAGWGETINELTVVYTRSDTWRDTTITLQDLASYQLQGPAAETRRYPGITDDALAARVAMRDLTALSRPLARVTFMAVRDAWNLLPGDAFKFTWPDLGIVDMVLRVVTVDTGTITDPAIRVEAIEDTWAFADTAYTEPQPVEWTDPTSEPVDVTPRLLLETSYWDLSQRLPPTTLDALDEFENFLLALGGRPSGDALNYELHTTSSGQPWGDETNRGTGDFAPHCVIDVDLAPEFVTTVPYIGGVDLDLVRVGRYAYLEDPDIAGTPNGYRHEAVEVTALDLVAGTVTLNRGLLDTTPAYHQAGVRLWFAEQYQAPDRITYIYTENVAALMLTRTGLGILAPGDATQENYTIAYRKEAPYPPGNLRFNGEAYPDGFEATLTVSWQHRDRLQQTADYPRQTDGSIGPEAGVTYTMRIYGETGTLQRTFSGITGLSQAYTVAEDIADNGLGRESRSLAIELEAVRAQFTSWYMHRYVLVRNDTTGYGLNWGYTYGGPLPP